ncbi:uncharacterized protein LOC106512146 [Austrofundulus limnaeus]|uniref:Uncharacterized protein LOC106512146 n=1 Tax=Austrofundulus limnaeus TaxID=52670 RepID=A0A2I4ALA8_AUSLI|nr:PREDICTED: uncharacterized protein LOC106512146 [Austrofundulus limnaeus]
MANRGKSDTSKVGRSKPRLSPEPEAAPVLDANERLLKCMEEMLEGVRSDLVSKFDEIVSGAVRREITSALAPLEAKVTSHEQAIADLERSATDRDDKLTTLGATVASLKDMVEFISKKCEDLEGRSRLNNVRVVGVPEGSEGSGPTDFVATLLQDLLGLSYKPALDRAHRTLRAKPTAGEPPCPFVARVNMFQQRNEILRKASEASPLIYNGRRISVFPDFTAAVAKKRTAFTKVKKELRCCPGVKFGLFYPAILRITLPNGQVQRFEDPSLAMDFVEKKLKNAVIPDSV